MTQGDAEVLRAVPGAPFNPETAAAAGRESARRRKAREREERANPSLKVARKMPELFDALLDAAAGRGEWHDLALDKRLAALFKALEYGAGKPITRDKQLTPADPGEGDGTEPAGGLQVV